MYINNRMSSISDQFTVTMTKKTNKHDTEDQSQHLSEFVDNIVKTNDYYHFVCKVCKKGGSMCFDEIDHLIETFELLGQEFQFPTKHKECKKLLATKKAPVAKEVPSMVTKAPNQKEDFPSLKVAVKAPTKSKELLELEAELEILKKEAKTREHEAPLIDAAKAEIAKLKAAAKVYLTVPIGQKWSDQ